ncbi:MAG: hypothetical protein KBT19_08665 [Lachnospiraceae bacterium]|nr:hypothetical protein [Candidatus Colinaster equi]
MDKIMNKSMEELVKEAQEALKNPKEMTEEEKIEYDAEFGYSEDDE